MRNAVDCCFANAGVGVAYTGGVDYDWRLSILDNARRLSAFASNPPLATVSRWLPRSVWRSRSERPSRAPSRLRQNQPEAKTSLQRILASQSLPAPR